MPDVPICVHAVAWPTGSSIAHYACQHPDRHLESGDGPDWPTACAFCQGLGSGNASRSPVIGRAGILSEPAATTIPHGPWGRRGPTKEHRLLAPVGVLGARTTTSAIDREALQGQVLLVRVSNGPRSMRSWWVGGPTDRSEDNRAAVRRGSPLDVSIHHPDRSLGDVQDTPEPG